jgi:molybdate transport system ATP-binding protein
MTLAAAIRTRAGDLGVAVDLDADAGEVVALLGPNGAGKTTILRALAGLAPIDGGRIVVDGTVVDDPAARVFVPPERRSVGVVFQDLALFPHLDALDNVAFGLRARGASRRDSRARAAEWLDRVGLGARARHRPDRLSGGEAQRVALARTLATGPRLLLLDEPLAALDVTVRDTLRAELRRHLGEVAGAVVLVTHDPVDAAALANRVVVVEEGAVVQAGTLADIAARPRSRYVADLAGVNLLAGEGRGDRVVLPSGQEVTAADRAAGAVLLVVHPHAVALHRAMPEGSPRNVWPGVVEGVVPVGRLVRIRLGGPVPLVAEVTAAAAADLALEPGDAVWASVKAAEITTHPA